MYASFIRQMNFAPDTPDEYIHLQKPPLRLTARSPLTGKYCPGKMTIAMMRLAKLAVKITLKNRQAPKICFSRKYFINYRTP